MMKKEHIREELVVQLSKAGKERACFFTDLSVGMQASPKSLGLIDTSRGVLLSRWTNMSDRQHGSVYRFAWMNVSAASGADSSQ